MAMLHVGRMQDKWAFLGLHVLHSKNPVRRKNVARKNMFGTPKRRYPWIVLHVLQCDVCHILWATHFFVERNSVNEQMFFFGGVVGSYNDSMWASCVFKEVSYVKIPVKFVDEDGATVVKSEPWPVIDVHNILHFLFDDAELQIPEETVHEYWHKSKQFGETWAQHISEEDYKKFIPIGLYGDSARVRTSFGSENVISIYCNLILWRPRSVRFSRFLVFTIPEERCTASTLTAAFRRITWSCNHAYWGMFPTGGPFGESLSGKGDQMQGQPLTKKGFQFQVTEIRGDWAWHKKIFKFYKCQWNGDKMCPFCDARGLSDKWEECYWNLENNNHVNFDLRAFLANRMPPRNLRNLNLLQL